MRYAIKMIQSGRDYYLGSKVGSEKWHTYFWSIEYLENSEDELLPVLFDSKIVARIIRQKYERSPDYHPCDLSVVLWKDVSKTKEHYYGEKYK